MSDNMIKFYKGPEANYNSELRSNANVIYFATDTNKIYVGGVAYGGSSGSFSGVYDSAITDGSVAMTTKYGDFDTGTTVSQLDGKTYDQLFDGILFPTINPTHTDPAVSGFALDSTTSPVELGTSVVGISAATLNKGKWSEYNNDNPYAGAATSTAYTFTINGTKYTAISDLANKKYTTVGNHTYYVKIDYSAGSAPLNNKGVSVPGLACPAGSVEATRTINVTLPWFATTATPGELTKQNLISWNTTSGKMTATIQMKNHTTAAPQRFKIPREVTTIKQPNVSGVMTAVAITDWTKESVKETVNGIECDYYLYTYKGAEMRDPVKLEISC